jgi:hypothetical protein
MIIIRLFPLMRHEEVLTYMKTCKRYDEERVLGYWLSEYAAAPREWRFRDIDDGTGRPQIMLEHLRSSGQAQCVIPKDYRWALQYIEKVKPTWEMVSQDIAYAPRDWIVGKYEGDWVFTHRPRFRTRFSHPGTRHLHWSAVGFDVDVLALSTRELQRQPETFATYL